jgi:integrase/recombinase XerC
LEHALPFKKRGRDMQTLGSIAPSADQEEIYLDDGREAKLPGFDPFFAAWIKHLRDSAGAHNTVSNYATDVRICVLFLTEVMGRVMSVDTFSRLRPDDIERMQQAMLNVGYQPNTIVVKMAGLRGFARFLHAHCGIRCDGIIISRLLIYGHAERYISPSEDRDNLVEAASADYLDGSWQEIRTRALAMLISIDGLKLGEALGLDFLDLSVTRLSALIRTGPKFRTAPLSSSTTQAITEYLTVCPFDVCEEWPLFVGKGGERLGHRTAQRSIAALRNQLGLHELMSSESLRNGRILELRVSGRNDFAIMEELGLSSRQSLERVLANLLPNYAAIELAAHQVREKFGITSTAHNGSPVEQQPNVTLVKRGAEYETQPGLRARRKRMASVHDADAAIYVDHLFKTKAHNTAISYSSVVRQFADEFLPPRQKQARTAGSEDIKAFQEARDAIHGASAAVRDRAALKDFYIFLFDRGAVAAIPVLDLEPGVRLERHRLRDAASTACVRAWISKLWHHTGLHPTNLQFIQVQAFVFLLALQGLKSSEALSLQKSALLGDTLQVKDRTLTLANITQNALQMLIDISPPAANMIFPGRLASQAISHRTMLTCMKKVEDRLDLPKVTPERLTQAFRRNLFATLGDALEVSRALGLRSSDQFAAGQRAQGIIRSKPSSTR